ncbi:hypothetical protein BJ742DRAFT_776372 [Cladochytrium replicatum]|nr:hypothetical protein BJ742DRAFT_776372 [Cladochytrium replicatum]
MALLLFNRDPFVSSFDDFFSHQRRQFISDFSLIPFSLVDHTSKDASRPSHSSESWAELLGFSKDHVKVFIKEDTLVIEADKTKKTSKKVTGKNGHEGAKDKDEKPSTEQTITRSLKRLIRSPCDVDPAKCTAVINEGSLEIKGQSESIYVMNIEIKSRL